MLFRLSPAAVVLATSLVGVACSAPPAPEEGDPGDDTSSEALRTVAASGTCNRARVMASVTGARRTVLSRGFKWLDDQVPYSQSRTHEGYRTDCSGFVSMCWQTGTSFTTAIFASGGGNASAIGAYGNLLPGDALVKRGHMMLFTGWADSAKTGICALEQASTASDMQFRVRAVSSLRGEGYKAIRSDAIAAGTSPSEPSEEEPTTEPTEPSEEEPTTEPPEEAEPAPAPKPAPAPSGSSSGGASTPPPAEEEPPAEEPPVADPTENPQPSQLEAEPSGTTKRTGKATRKETTSPEEDEDEASSGRAATAQQGSACTVARAGAPARGPGLGLGLGLAALGVLRRRRRA